MTDTPQSSTFTTSKMSESENHPFIGTAKKGQNDDDDILDADFSDSSGDWIDQTETNQSHSTREQIPQSKDIKMINIIRSFVVLLMLTIAMVAANSVFVYAVIQEEMSYDRHFQDISLKMIDNFYAELDRKMSSALALSTTFTSFAHSTSALWPYITFPDFGEQCLVPRESGRLSAVSFSPLVEQGERETWEGMYAAHLAYQVTADEGLTDPLQEEAPTKFYVHHNRSIEDGIYHMQDGRAVNVPPNASDLYFPTWQTTPLSANATEIMFAHGSNPLREKALAGMMAFQAGACSNVLLHSSNRTDYAFYSTPRSTIYYPLWHSLLIEQHTSIAGALGLEFRWETFMGTDVLQDAAIEDSLVVVLESSCGGAYSFEVTSDDVSYLGEGSLYDASVQAPGIEMSDYDQFAVRLLRTSTSSSTSTSNESMHELLLMHENRTTCDFRIQVYPTEDYRNSFLTSEPLYLKLIVAGIFIFTISVFLIYDCIVDSYQKRMIESAEKTHAIVRALFPKNVRDRLLRQSTGAAKQSQGGGASFNKDVSNWSHDSTGSRTHQSPKFRLASMLQSGTGTAPTTNSEGSTGFDISRDEPLADLYPEVTILFSDIAGFTAWSSEREPAQVFTLLESLYGAMDKIAMKLGVFKVETIGDCYVAATGLPIAKKDHAEIMVRFARYSMTKCHQLLHSLEATLGPGTAELGMRTGIHSGAVTAGVLRGQKSRFQLFGDAMNTASRIESTGMKNKIHLSASVVKYLEKGGKSHWVIQRGQVTAKGKGELNTYWLKLGNGSNAGSTGDNNSVHQVTIACLDESEASHSLAENTTLGPVLHQTVINATEERLVEWNCDVLMNFLSTVVACRGDKRVDEADTTKEMGTNIPLKEMTTVIVMPEYTESLENTKRVELPHIVRSEMLDYVRTIASGYQRNSFHNFEHASHVALSATKLLKRIDCADAGDGSTMEELYEHTYGITSDPLTKFAVVFAALIHDVGHTGVSNHQLGLESPDVAERYENTCIAEQRSIDVAWELLMLPRYKNLRRCMFGNQPSEGQRFRQLLVNCVIATDIFNKELTTLRKDRWAKAFAQDARGPALMTSEDLNQKATIVIEHIIQASDVSHTMQHWHIYKKWNARLFEEMHDAYKAGRMAKDPSTFWYQGEIGFFDNYVIPLTKKLKECGVFGASGDEYHQYAIRNREQWAVHGEELCQQMFDRVKEKVGTNEDASLGGDHDKK